MLASWRFAHTGVRVPFTQGLPADTGRGRVRPMKPRTLSTFLAGLVLLGAGAGCQRIRANQRETLARPDMELGAAGDLTRGEDHARAYREGATGGGAGKAGGCGCN